MFANLHAEGRILGLASESQPFERLIALGAGQRLGRRAAG
jgi:hypothetical protein